MPYTPTTNEDVKMMLEKMSLKNIDELFSIIPSKFKYDINELNINESLTEMEIENHMSEIANLNMNASKSLCFLGGGSYDHYIPKIVDTLSSRSEYYTAYTPYQPEVSQGTLQYLYEFQSMVCKLSGMEIANASLYDGASAVAEACSMALSVTRKKNILVSSSLNPSYIELINIYFKYRDVKVTIINVEDGITSINKLKALIDDEVAAIVIQSPNYYGIIEDWEEVSKYKKNSLLIAVSDPISMSILKSPFDCNCDVYVGEGQSLGNYMSLGGPYIGLFATKIKYARKMPGRIIGRTVDQDNKQGFVMTLQTREQHIRRERATSNICTNQGLMALRATIYMALLGKQGLPHVANLCFQNAQYAADKIKKLKNYQLFTDNRAFVKEFVIKTKKSAKSIQKKALKSNMLIHAIDDNKILLAFTEKRSTKDIDELILFLKNN